MRLLLLVLAFELGACRDAPAAGEKGDIAAFEGPCQQRAFEGDRFTVCSEARGTVEVRTGFRSFGELERALGKRADDVAFAMNAGMFNETGGPIGLLIERRRQVQKINRREGGGNFHLMPNGVFLVRENGKAEVVTSVKFRPARDIAFATQSGPMLVIDGKLHPKFDGDGQSRLIRNGVGIGPDGMPLFVISDDPVSFGKFARFYRDGLKSRNALFFDGSVSSLWDPASYRMDAAVPLGPMVVVFKRR